MTSKSIAFVHMVEGMSIKNSVLLFSYQHRTTILLCESSAVSMFCKVLLLCFLLSSVLITCTFQSSWFALPLFQLPHEVNGSQSISPEAFMTTVRIVVIVLRIVQQDICDNHQHYQVEIHKVTTEDGYILELHRIPSSQKSPIRSKGKPVFLQHGIFASDHVWVIAPSDRALGN